MTPQTSAARMPEIKVPGLLTLLGLLAGLGVGLLLAGSAALPRVLAVAEPAGGLWLAGLKMTILPLVCGLLFTGIVDTVAAARAGAMARRTLGFIVGILALSALVGGTLIPALIALFDPPRGLVPSGTVPTAAQVPGLADFLRSLLPVNVVTAASDDALLPVIVFTALFAVASTRLADAPRRTLALLFEGMAGAMMVVIGWVLALAPIGVFALGLALAAQSGAAALGVLATYIALVSTCGAVFLLLAYLVAAVLARKPLGAFAAAVLPAQVVAVSTQSSLASLPAMLAACRRLDVRSSSAEFVLPLAVTMFRATSPAMNVAVCVYAAHVAGVELSFAALAAGVFVGFLTTFGSVSLPGTISFVASTAPIAAAMGVPLWPLGVLVAVEMLPDIMRTVGNVTMDVAVTGAVDAGEPEPDTQTLH